MTALASIAGPHQLQGPARTFHRVFEETTWMESGGRSGFGVLLFPCFSWTKEGRLCISTKGRHSLNAISRALL
jgi:hypothetical protein